MLQELFGRHKVKAGSEPLEITFRNQKIVIAGGAAGAYSYKRYAAGALAAETTIVSDKDDGIVVGIFPIAPLLTPKQVAKNMYIKFRSPVVMDQRSDAVVYTKIPIEIGVYRQSEDEELLIDAFSLSLQRYALYGSPEAGTVCRFFESETSTTEDGICAEKYTEATVRIRISNAIDNVVKISKVIVPMDGVVLDHAQDDAWVPGGVDVRLDVAFGKDIVNVRINTKVKRADKTSVAKREETLVFMMDAGY
ncbi:DUF432 domain-containing protein [Nitrososphaera viennensis]|uniref:DUF432 domain-containing protein n=1 Tax=Nitrososphaera viennensis TaxID=1034015 RepID=A0A977IEB3_9ARCH|nr:DUF432 domain-containing protein [Nitrososphaera viennensis]UVS69195.1 DUF432 domain-containing protein [Nitrososphaera viennensis]